MKMMKCKLLLVIGLLITMNFSSKAQPWMQVGSGLPVKPISLIKSTSDSVGTIYVAMETILGRIEVWKYNQLSWSRYPYLNNRSPIASRLTPSAISVYKGEVFVSYHGEGFHKGNVAVFRNGNWVRLFSTNTDGVVADFLNFRDTLFMGGNFRDVSNPNLRTFASYDGQQLDTLPPPSSFIFDSISDLKVYNNQVFAHGIMQDFFIGSYGGGTWNTVIKKPGGTNYSNSIITSAKLDTGWFGITLSGRLRQLVKDSAVQKGFITGYKNSGYVSKEFVVFNNRWYISQGKGSFLPNNYLIEIDSAANVIPLSSPPGPLGGAISQDSILYVFLSDSAISNNGTNFAFSTIANPARISGLVYLDRNGDCSYNSGDRPIPFSLLSFNGSGVTSFFSGNNTGNFSALVPPGTYSFAPPVNIGRQYLRLSSSCTLPSSISLSANQNFQQDIALQHDGSIDALIDLESYSGQATFGFTENYKISVQNPGGDVTGLINVELTLPPTMTYVNATPNPTSVNGQVISFTYNSLQMFEEKSIDLLLRTDTAGNSLGDTLCLLAALNGINGDVNVFNNKDTLCLEVRGAYDPNDKTPSDTQIKPGTSRIDYRIRFQNTGNSPAVKVTVVDTLDLTLPVTAIIMNSASHPYSISVQNNILIWEFNNIMLPDSTTDPLGSQGYISFSAGLNPALGLGDSIFNDAEIYFDYQKPIHTNVAKTAIVNNVSLVENSTQKLLNVYPNPATENIFVEWEGSKPVSFQLLDVSGKELMQFDLNKNEKQNISLQALPKGVYFLNSSVGTYKILVQ